MVLKKLSELDDGGLITAGDQLLIARSGENYKIDGAQIANTVAKVANTVERLDALEGAAESGIAEAPLDGKTYARKDAAWVEASTGGGGGTGTSLFPIKPPVLADFTVSAGRGFSSATQGTTLTSFLRNYNGESSTQVGAFQGVPLTGATWEATAIVRMPLFNATGSGLTGIGLRDSTGRMYQFGIEGNNGNPQISVLYMTGDGANYSTSGGSRGGMARLEWFAFRIRKTTGFYYFDYSPDFGVTWVQMTGFTLDNFLTDAHSVGLVMQTYGYTVADSLVCAYWDLKYT